MRKSVLAFTLPVLVGGPWLGAAQELTKCIAGQQVVDKEGKTGVIVADDSKLCSVRYPDRQIYSWIYWNLIPAVSSRKPGLAPLPRLRPAARPHLQRAATAKP
jgi:hypothetical protein